MNAPIAPAQRALLSQASQCGEGGKLRERGAAFIYRLLAGCDPSSVCLAEDRAFDRHVFASLIAVAASEDSSIAHGVGLSGGDFAGVMARWFPQALDAFHGWPARAEAPDDDEIVMVRDLLMANRSTAGQDSRWLAFMIARRAVEPNHLWEDLGLRERPELSRLLGRHFAPLAMRNTKNMKWKRFFYRALCESDGLVMCTTPVCTNCRDFDLCFGEESGESRLANARRIVALGNTAS